MSGQSEMRFVSEFCLFVKHLPMLNGECEWIALLICFLYSSFKQQFSLLALMSFCWATEVLSWKVPPPELWWVTQITHTLHSWCITIVEVSIDIVTLPTGKTISIEIFHQMIHLRTCTRNDHPWYFSRQDISFGAETLAFKCHVNRVFDNTFRCSIITGTGCSSGLVVYVIHIFSYEQPNIHQSLFI